MKPMLQESDIPQRLSGAILNEAKLLGDPGATSLCAVELRAELGLSFPEVEQLLSLAGCCALRRSFAVLFLTPPFPEALGLACVGRCCHHQGVGLVTPDRSAALFGFEFAPKLDYLRHSSIDFGPPCVRLLPLSTSELQKPLLEELIACHSRLEVRLLTMELGEEVGEPVAKELDAVLGLVGCRDRSDNVTPHELWSLARVRLPAPAADRAGPRAGPNHTRGPPFLPP
mmetsp:Transcript_13340/g.35795  ORF Transcript_13340/g.35795 Transcript_13340/m.35795 type:complete len:228 (-) Transcript_13340:5-688(-)